MTVPVRWLPEDEADLAATEREVERLSYAPRRGGFSESRREQLAACVRWVERLRRTKERLV